MRGCKRGRSGQDPGMGEQGVALIEATLGTVLLILAALIAMQLVLVFHGSLAIQSAVARAARTYAITNRLADAQVTYERQRSSSLRFLKWESVTCQRSGGIAQCTGSVRIPSLFPGAGLLGDGEPWEDVRFTETGSYPIGAASGG